MTVTATQGGTGASNGTTLLVRVLTGAVEAGGATAANFGTSVTASASITPVSTNSLPVYSLTNEGPSNTLTAATNNTNDAGAGVAGDFYSAMGRYTGTVTSGTPITVGSSTSGTVTWSIYEILPSGGTTPVVDASSPVFVNVTALVATTASFTPPAGSVVVAMVGAGGGNFYGTTMTVTDTGGGLVWTQRAFTDGSSHSSDVWTATVSSGPAIQPTEHQLYARQAVKRAALW